MLSLTSKQLDEIWHDIYNVKSRFVHLPFCRLKKAGSHSFGTLRLWPKLKSLKAGVSSWEEIKWRPLASYFLHRWSKLFRLAAKWCNFVVFTFKEGFAISNHRFMVERVLKFNENFLPTSDPPFLTSSPFPRQPTTLEQSLYDIKEFFTWVPRDQLKLATDYYVNLIAQKFGSEFRWF